MQAISLEPADGAKSLVISLRQASKPFDSFQMTRCHFPAVILPLTPPVTLKVHKRSPHETWGCTVEGTQRAESQIKRTEKLRHTFSL